MDPKSKYNRRLPSTLISRFETKTRPTETERLGALDGQKRTSNGVSSKPSSDLSKENSFETRTETDKQIPKQSSNRNADETDSVLDRNLSESVKTVDKNCDAVQNDSATIIIPALGAGLAFKRLTVNENAPPTEVRNVEALNSKIVKERLDPLSNKDELLEKDPARHNQGCSNSNVEQFSSAWIDSEPCLPLESVEPSSSQILTGEICSSPGNIQPSSVVPTSREERLPSHVSTSDETDVLPKIRQTFDDELTEPHSIINPSTLISTNKVTPFLPVPTIDNTLPPDTVASTWIDDSDTGPELTPDTELDSGSSDSDEAGDVDDDADCCPEGGTGSGGLEWTSDTADRGPNTEEPSFEHVDYNAVADFDIDELSEAGSDDDDLPSLSDIYQRCQTIRRKRYFGDLYNAWQQNVQEEAREDAMKILSACGFRPVDPDEMGEEIDAGLRLVPDRFWQQDSRAKEISVEDLKAVLEAKKDAESRKNFQQYCAETEREHHGATRRRAIVVGGGGGGGDGTPSLLYNFLKMNLLNCRVPMYYFPSYLRRYQATMERQDDDDDQSDGSDSS